MYAKVFVKPDGSVSILRLSGCRLARLDNESDRAYLDRVALFTVNKVPKLQGLPMMDVEESELPEYDTATRDKWRWDGVRVVIDHSVITEAEKRQALEDEIDVELGSERPDPIKVAQLVRRLEKGEF